VSTPPACGVSDGWITNCTCAVWILAGWSGYVRYQECH
jgi:hypothetical protein